MGARLELQPGVGARPLHGGHGLLDATQLRLVEGHHVQGEAPALGIHGVHPQQVGGKQRALLAADAGPDFQHHVLVVVGVTGQQQALQFILQPLPLRLGGGQLLLAQLLQLGVGQHFRGGGHIGLRPGVGPVCLHHRRQLLLFAAQLRHGRPVAVHRRVGELALHLGQTLGDLFQLIQHGRSPDTAARRR